MAKLRPRKKIASVTSLAKKIESIDAMAMTLESDSELNTSLNYTTPSVPYYLPADLLISDN
jgi:hypothetical protein